MRTYQECAPWICVSSSRNRFETGVATGSLVTHIQSRDRIHVDRLHHDEVPIDHSLVRKLLTEQMPHVAGLRLRAVEPQGTENLTFRLGAELSIRLPASDRRCGA
jgi:hypothetical protein